MPEFVEKILAGDEADKHGDRIRDYANKAWLKSQPWDVEGPLGKATFDQAEQKITSELSPEMQGVFDASLADLYQQKEYISPYEADPDTAAQTYYQRWEDITQPQREQQLHNLENRQLAQGMLYSTGGNMREAALREAHNMDKRQARHTSDAQVQGMIDTYRNRGQQDLGNLGAIGTMINPYAPLGQNQGAVLSGPAFAEAGMLSTASDMWRQGQNMRTQGYVQAGEDVVQAIAMAYGASDYRLKEDIKPMEDSVERVMELKPSTFKFTSDPDKTTVDGFIAHEAQEVVPESVHGEKDAVDSEGTPVYQAIDQSKIVPVLTGAIQELVKEVQSMKTELEIINSKIDN
jgi:hypothetical protein